ncbi:hypothetical protein HS088_TW17G01096 [Tripterygium wilfordii]|uniref:Uncharacterized protein n=1 Tax=Tripterygium wilfordii TaxID=458696 RepID=A0A7J7CHL3_TRIWF|nr:hypothetical protein HS088_TW17G01096 [Tripterygium wilfordii]
MRSYLCAFLALLLFLLVVVDARKDPEEIWKSSVRQENMPETLRGRLVFPATKDLEISDNKASDNFDDAIKPSSESLPNLDVSEKRFGFDATKNWNLAW